MILISGATGFIGSRLLATLEKNNLVTRKLTRSPQNLSDGVSVDLNDTLALANACNGVETVFHCAGYAHAFSSMSADDAALHWQINYEGTRNLVEAAGRAGVGRFVFLSSVKAMAEPGKQCADEDFPGEPSTAYGKSKRAAEAAVIAAGQRYGMHVVNLRLSMVYGAGGRGNLERMGRLVSLGWFPPLPETGNHRSLVHIDDVVSAMRLVAEDDRACGKTYIVAGEEAPSGRCLFDALCAAQGRAPYRWSVPVPVLRVAAGIGDTLEIFLRRRLPLNGEVLSRLLGSAWYSSARIERELGWKGKISLADGLLEMLQR